MRTDTFVGTDLRNVFDLARNAMGDEIVILNTNITQSGLGRRVELTVAQAGEVDQLREQVTPPAVRRGSRNGRRPLVIGVVGPTGAGKTTTAAKLALAQAGFAGQRVGLLTIDTYRIGAVEQITQIAELARLPIAVAHDAAEVRRALLRFNHCDVVVIDTPGRGPRTRELNDRSKLMLRAAKPDEIHFVVPAVMRPDLAIVLRDRYADAAPTFALITKVDELTDRHQAAELMLGLEMPARWIGDGQDLARDLQDARAQFPMVSPLRAAPMITEVAA